ncbi:MAG: divergent polysaccharide deacetylase family protein [Candidatus Omnitrophica bacterium]|nr:divergent polysaccharide deacetylase family protein [Candidatus Omnitrophota bacterium]MDD5654856.1 divergent polysaccharide deacetylase family protein [Candidatus Omnitrophota bacterium]
MESNSKNKIIILFLLLVVILQAVVIIRLFPKKPVKVPPVAVAKAGRIAIVLDDWGYNRANIHYLNEIKQRMTISVLPHQSYSQIASFEARKKGFEVILHLPMEPGSSERVRLEPNTILSGMTEDRIKAILKDDLSNVYGVVGVSNHMGSKATADPGLMTAVLKDIKARGLYFLDSYVSSRSVVSALSRRLGVKSAKRDVFLDNSSDAAYIRGQISRLKSIARKRGYAIGIGHDRPATLAVLKAVMPELEKEGFKFVFVSELVK